MKKEIKNLITKCVNEEMPKLLYEIKLNSDVNDYIQWIPFNEFSKN